MLTTTVNEAHTLLGLHLGTSLAEVANPLIYRLYDDTIFAIDKAPTRFVLHSCQALAHKAHREVTSKGCCGVVNICFGLAEGGIFAL